ncbi:23S rRNA (guanine(2445)-N(2))/(guanine(2069)-N(7))-methyltransferase, partial [bacterium]|nr:23S rRNA (guanine(2445)-N(2))/(guanine(2069)-N(7))-methyltransferase [candidate division CSSED10-310 bacterium]
MLQTFFAPTPRYTEDLLVEELARLGVVQVKERPGGVRFEGSLETAYRVCLWSRLAARVLLPIAEFDAAGRDELYAGAKAVDWTAHMAVDHTFAVDATVRASAMEHSRYAALLVKDAVADHFRERFGRRPSVDVQRPMIRLNLYLGNDHAVLSIDLSGTGLHERGYRQPGT